MELNLSQHAVEHAEADLKNLHDPQRKLTSIGWQDLPLITCTDRQYRYWRLTTEDPNQRNGDKMWMVARDGQIKSAETEIAPMPVIHGCMWRLDKLCAFVSSNYPLFPLTHQVTAEKNYAIALNTYQYQVRNKTMPPLEGRHVRHIERVFATSLARWRAGPPVRGSTRSDASVKIASAGNGESLAREDAPCRAQRPGCRRIDCTTWRFLAEGQPCRISRRSTAPTQLGWAVFCAVGEIDRQHECADQICGSWTNRFREPTCAWLHR